MIGTHNDDATHHVEARRLADRLWRFCEMLNDTGIPVVDTIMQLSYLMVLKLASEKVPSTAEVRAMMAIKGIGWDDLAGNDPASSVIAYETVLAVMRERNGILGTIFHKAHNTFSEPVLLWRLIHEAVETENWATKEPAVLGHAYDLLLGYLAAHPRSVVGQHFTPRPLISAIVDCVQPTAGEVLIDPACGTGGFLVSAREFINRQVSARASVTDRFIVSDVRGIERIGIAASLAAMNLWLHGIDRDCVVAQIKVCDALDLAPSPRASLVLSVPPLGLRSSITTSSERTRERFRVATTNNQLNFLQYIAELLELGGRAAVVVTDNVLFDTEAGTDIRRHLLTTYDVHTLLRLPTGLFYASGVQTNVLFFDRVDHVDCIGGAPATTEMWVYDLRTGQPPPRVRNRLQRDHFHDFVQCYQPGNRANRTETERFRRYPCTELLDRDAVNLDIACRDDLQQENDYASTPEDTAAQIVEELQAALAEFTHVTAMLRQHRPETGNSSGTG